MARIRKIEIRNFRSISSLDWFPGPGINCLIGPGDSGKSTILDAIDLCLGARRTVAVGDDDFHALNSNVPIQITITLGDLDNNLRSLETYGPYLRGYQSATGAIEQEPSRGLETVLSLQLEVGSDLEPQWRLASERATAQGLSRGLAWADRFRLAPTRLGQTGEHNLSWRRGSILNKVSDERANATAAIAQAARDARAAFGDGAREQLGIALAATKAAADRLGVPVGPEVKALLEIQSGSFAGGTISLHDSAGVPLRGLGLGSVRLLITGLQRHAAADSTMILIDELEHGLEPHRIIRLLGELGAKDQAPPLQAFVTTHSPVAVRELSVAQLHVVRPGPQHHRVAWMGAVGDVQGTVRSFPDALLARSVLVCEGASEVGLMRGLDLYRQAFGNGSLLAQGVAFVDGGGDSTFARALAFQQMGYRSAVLRDSDVAVHQDLEVQFRQRGGSVFAWAPGNALEDELCLCLADQDLDALLSRAVALKEQSLVDEHIRSVSDGAHTLVDIQTQLFIGGATPEIRTVLGRAARVRNGWFKSIAAMEAVALDIIGPGVDRADPRLRAALDAVFAWCTNA